MPKRPRPLPKKQHRSKTGSVHGIQWPLGENVRLHPQCVNKVKADLADTIARLPEARQEALEATVRVANYLERCDHGLPKKLAIELTELLSTMLRALSSMDTAMLIMQAEVMAAQNPASYKPAGREEKKKKD